MKWMNEWCCLQSPSLISQDSITFLQFFQSTKIIFINFFKYFPQFSSFPWFFLFRMFFVLTGKGFSPLFVKAKVVFLDKKNKKKPSKKDIFCWCRLFLCFLDKKTKENQEKRIFSVCVLFSVFLDKKQQKSKQKRIFWVVVLFSRLLLLLLQNKTKGFSIKLTQAETENWI